jgi:hypothetical protein
MRENAHSPELVGSFYHCPLPSYSLEDTELAGYTIFLQVPDNIFKKLEIFTLSLGATTA